MSRGPGKIQRNILDLLAENGPLWLIDIIDTLSQSRGAEPGEPSRSLAASVRRAVQSLEKRGMVRCGNGKIQYAVDEYRYCRKIVWLPDQPAPEISFKKPMPGARVREVVWEILTTAEGAEKHSWEGWIEAHPNLVPYSWLCYRVLKHFEITFSLIDNGAREYTAINRAVWSLIREERAEAYEPPEGVKRPSIGWVKALA